RLGTESEVSAAICFLLSPAAAFISGAVLRVDGAAPTARLASPLSALLPGAPENAARGEGTWPLQPHERSQPWHGFHRAGPRGLFAAESADGGRASRSGADAARATADARARRGRPALRPGVRLARRARRARALAREAAPDLGEPLHRPPRGRDRRAAPAPASGV